MAKDYMFINSTPTYEVCVQVKENHHYIADMRVEAKRYREMLKIRFPDFDKVYFIIKNNSQESGNYISIHISYNYNNPESISQATFIGNNLPKYWDDDEIFTSSCTEYSLWKKDHGYYEEEIISNDDGIIPNNSYNIDTHTPLIKMIN